MCRSSVVTVISGHCHQWSLSSVVTVLNIISLTLIYRQIQVHSNRQMKWSSSSTPTINRRLKARTRLGSLRFTISSIATNGTRGTSWLIWTNRLQCNSTSTNSRRSDSRRLSWLSTIAFDHFWLGRRNHVFQWISVWILWSFGSILRILATRSQRRR